MLARGQGLLRDPPLSRDLGRRAATASAALVAAGLALPPAASAHGLIQRANLPLPEWLFGWAAAVVLVLSFVALAVLWRRPQFEDDRWRPLPGPLGRALGGRAAEVAAGVLGVTLLVAVLVAGLLGTQNATGNLAPTFVLIVFWVGLAFASALFGDLFRALSPWRALGRATGWAVRRGRDGAGAPRRAYPERLGRWPAVAALAYTALTLAGQAVFGVEAWSTRAEAFSVLFGLFARIAPLQSRDGVVGVRPPLGGLTRLDAVPGTIAFVATMIGTVTFDGLGQGSLWAQVRRPLDNAFAATGAGADTVQRLSDTVGMIACVATVAGFYALGTRWAHRLAPAVSAERLRGALVHALVPIALVYVAAHYLTFLLFEGQAIAYLLSDPLGRGWDLFGTASSAVDYGVLSQNGVWYAQVACVVAGHVAALMLAHDRALTLYEDGRAAARSQYAMLVIMVGFTTLALWLLAQAGTA